MPSFGKRFLLLAPNVRGSWLRGKTRSLGPVRKCASVGGNGYRILCEKRSHLAQWGLARSAAAALLLLVAPPAAAVQVV